MLDFYLLDLLGNADNGKWSVIENRLIRLDNQDKELYFYEITNTHHTSFIQDTANYILDLTTFKLIDNGIKVPLNIIFRYKLYDKIITVFDEFNDEKEVDNRPNYLSYTTTKRKPNCNTSSPVDIGQSYKERYSGRYIWPSRSTNEVDNSLTIKKEMNFNKSIPQHKINRILQLISKNEKRTKYQL